MLHDVLIFFDGSPGSLRSIIEVLDEFGLASGLRINVQKSSLFLAGQNELESEAFNNFGFPLGSFPIRYLGLPLVPRKLKISEYDPLVTKLIGKFNAWSAKAISYAGRLQLIKSVIMGSLNFWFSAFLLPKGCIQKLESLIASFLWTGSAGSRGTSQVKWSDLCLPKVEGGLGLRSLKLWNITLILKLTWLLFARSGSLWVAWLTERKLQSYSFWAMEEKQSDSWAWKCLLRLRHLAKMFIKCELGNGRETFFWFDHWTPFGSLLDFIGPQGPRFLGLHKHAKVSEACVGSAWFLRNPRSSESLSLHAYLTTITPPGSVPIADRFVWSVGEKKYTKYCTAATWECLRLRAAPKSWTNVTWFKGAIPRNAFLLWRAALNRLPTRNRLLQWGINTSPLCGLCSMYEEDRDHLFLRCEFSMQVWFLAMTRLRFGQIAFHNWSAFMAWAQSTSSTAPALLRKIVLQSVVSHLWRERNTRIHNNIAIPPSTLFKFIDREVKNTISAKRNNARFDGLMAVWLY